ncbi:MAG: Cache 3/Cache 2 fusion domain-containing protein [Candidatus Omnitrophota bacterium]
MQVGKLIAVTGVSLALLTGGATLANAQDAAAKVKDAMSMLKEQAAALGAPKLDGDSLFMGTTEMNGNFDIVDEIADAKSCTATIFAKKDANFVRVATNVIKEGKRAVGTILDPAGAAYADINKGEAHYGPVDILGKQYEAGYEPIKDESGAIIGILYVGYKL